MTLFLKLSVAAVFLGLAISPVTASAESGEQGSAPSSALVVYNEYYVPDSIRSKYHLENKPSTPAENLPIVEDVRQEAPEQNDTPLTGSSALPTPPTSPTQAIETWRARKGENLRNVLTRWAARESVDLKWNSKSTPDLSKDFSFVGKFEDAVAKLLEEATGNHLQSQVKDSL
ncbi:MAG: TcpQ domain-containing protein [Alphaproteobacteria bacterium]|nr:TcpQ domain-containing protein [Alphaproteobacteria bacterium]